MSFDEKDTFIVVGSGVFGASTALELVRSGKNVIVLDRSKDGYCAPDAASNDLNKIIRSDYSDSHYRDLAKVAISIWRRSELLSKYYHEVGVVFHTGTNVDPRISQTYIDGAIEAASFDCHKEIPAEGQNLKPVAYQLTNQEQIKNCFPFAAREKLGPLLKDVESGRNKAYVNGRGGWAEANAATCAVLDEARRLGAQIVGEAHVDGLLLEDSNDPKRVTGVRCSDSRKFKTTGQGQTILCLGAWAENFLRSIASISTTQFHLPTWSSAQVVIAIQLNERQQEEYRNTPVVLCFENGNYCFEPSESGLMKVAVHSGGFRYPLPSSDRQTPLSFPTFQDSINQNGGGEQGSIAIQGAPASVVKQARCPPDQAKQILQNLSYIYPELANAPIVYDRICFYNESLDENWVIDHIPGLNGLIVATGDSGHAFKFLPILGNLVCARMGIKQAGTLTEHQDRVFSFAYHTTLHEQSSHSHQRESSDFKARL